MRAETSMGGRYRTVLSGQAPVGLVGGVAGTDAHVGHARAWESRFGAEAGRGGPLERATCLTVAVSARGNA